MDEIMEEIDFVNGETPASAETMKAFQTNIKNGIQKRTRQMEIWTNPSPTSSFASQTITLNESDFDYLIIFAYRNISNENNSDTIFLLLEKNKRGYINHGDYFDGGPRNWNRQVTCNNNQIIFGNATLNESTNNALLVPYKILGCNYLVNN